MKRAILFDKDGTLVDFETTWAPVNRASTLAAARGDVALAAHLLAACGCDPATGRTRGDSLFAAANASEIAQGMIDQGAAFDRVELTAILDRLFVEGARHAVALVDTPPLFARLRKAGIRLGIASSDNEASIHVSAQSIGIDAMLDFVAGYDSGHGVKPGPGMALAFCKATGIDPRDAVMVGDNRHDMEMGRAAGYGLTVGVLSGTGTHETLSALADHVIDDIGQLPELLQLS